MTTTRLDEILNPPDHKGRSGSHIGVETPGTALDALLERVLVVRDSLALLKQTGASGEQVDRAQAHVDACVDFCQATTLALEAGAASALATLQELGGEAEIAVRLVERELPMDSFAPGFVESALPKAQIARLSRLLAPLCVDNGDARDRFEFLVTRLLRLRGPSGFILLPRDAVQAALDYVAPVELRSCTDEGRRSVLDFVDQMAARIQGTESIDQVFTQGIYADLYGYKLALRERIVDPEVLYAIASLNTRICQRLQAAVVRTGRSEPYLKKINDTELKVREVLGEEPRRGDLVQKFQQARRRAAVSSQRPRSVTPHSGTQIRRVDAPRRFLPTRKTLGVIAACATLLVAGTAIAFNLRSAYRMDVIPNHELWKLSPVLHSGLILAEQRVFLGQVDPARWERLDQTLRLREAEALRETLRQRDIGVAILSSGDQVVCEIDARGDIDLW